MGTVLDILNQAALLCSMRASGEIMDAALGQDLLIVLNQLIDSWNIESLMIYQIDRQVFPLQHHVQTYSVGPGGDYNMVRPVRLDDVNWLDDSQFYPLELPLHAMSEDEYHNLAVRSVPSVMPTQFYYDQAYPLATLFFWPLPTVTRKVVLFAWHPWDRNNVLTTQIAMPPGYERMLVSNLAVEFSQQPGARLSPQTLQIAQESKAMVQSQNVDVGVLTVDFPMGRPRAGFNYLVPDP